MVGLLYLAWAVLMAAHQGDAGALSELEQCAPRAYECHGADFVAVALAPSIEGHKFRRPTESQQAPYVHAIDHEAARCDRHTFAVQTIFSPAASALRRFEKD